MSQVLVASKKEEREMLRLFSSLEEEQVIKDFDEETYETIKEREVVLNAIFDHLKTGKRAFTGFKNRQEGLLCLHAGGEAKFQFTYFDEHGPVGHTTGDTLENMALRIEEYGFEPIEEEKLTKIC